MKLNILKYATMFDKTYFKKFNIILENEYFIQNSDKQTARFKHELFV